MARESALWMGDMSDYMDENFIIEAFRIMGEETIQNVKIMKNRQTGLTAGYCFVNFISEEAAITAMHKLNGKMVPNSNPQVRFKLNHNTTRPGPGTAGSDREFSLWVGDLSPDVDDFQLYKTFAARYNSIKTAKVIYEQNGQSKGFSFVRFGSEEEYKDAMVHMQNFQGLGTKLLRVSYAVPKKPSYNNQPLDYNNHSQNNSQQPYYDQNQQFWSNNGGWYQGMEQPVDMYPSGPGGNIEYEAPAADQTKPNKDDFTPVEWDVPVDAAELNRKFIDQTEDLWKTLEKHRWSFWENASVVYP